MNIKVPIFFILITALACGGKNGNGHEDADADAEVDIAADEGMDIEMDPVPDVQPDPGADIEEDVIVDVEADPDADVEEEIWEYSPLYGWGGFVRASDEVIPLLDKLQDDGWNIVRYQSVPEWAQPEWGSFDIDHTVLRHLVDEAKARDMHVMLNLAHNFYSDGEPAEGFPGFYIDGHRDEWISQYIADAGPYKEDHNVILEIANEYGSNRQSHQDEVVAHFNAMILALRDEGFDQYIQCNFWWNQDFVVLDDPLGRAMVGRHYYGQPFDDYNPPTPIDFNTACEASGVNDAIDRLFSGSVADAEALGLPFCATELGASYTYSTDYGGWYVMSVGGIAYVMRFLQEAASRDVSVIMHRIGSRYGDYDLYYEKALEYFGMDFRP